MAQSHLALGSRPKPSAQFQLAKTWASRIMNELVVDAWKGMGATSEGGATSEAKARDDRLV